MKMFLMKLKKKEEGHGNNMVSSGEGKSYSNT